VTPARGPRKSWLFSFRDLIVLRTAQALAQAQIPPRRINRSLKELKRRLPDAMPLSGLSIEAQGGRVVVKDGARRWQADSGQYVLDFEGDPAAGSLAVIARGDASAASSAEDWFERGCELERRDAGAAREAYERVLQVEPAHAGAHLNLGRLLHEKRRLAESERVYRRALLACGSEPLLLYNLGVLLEDMGRKSAAMDAYEKALGEDPRFADCHYNLALLCKSLGRPKQALKHMAQYRRLVKPGA
jgi:tetratricopeptide (TPR) repeat protein